ncbi:FtsB family cell division protein [Azospirillum thermophilum]|uniref:Septation ring formation regulator EzrA n=1 Tax=Azospirillum thermophilum TaxID=2202148 RepID=A0A2S2CRY7_9PROT|nr:septum formation initiator family protein [Azospirillum thermophilum]AWK87057.1 septation ring formation regulator EzrA [Azospirillum thermophilum]
MTMIANISLSLKRAAKSALRQAIGPAIGSCVVAYFAYYAIHGDRGLVAMQQIQNEIAQAESILKQVSAERELMERRAQLLRGDHLDLDMLDERARSMLNLSNPRDVIVTLPKVYDQDEVATEKRPGSVN